MLKEKQRKQIKLNKSFELIVCCCFRKPTAEGEEQLNSGAVEQEKKYPIYFLGSQSFIVSGPRFDQV